MKILIISDAWYPQLNGVVRTYEYLREELLEMGHKVRVIGPADFSRSFAMPGYDEIRLVLFSYGPLQKMIKEYDPGLIHIATEGPLGWAARKYCYTNKIEFTSCYHTHFPDYIAKRVARYIPFMEGITHRLGIWYVKAFHNISSCVFAATQSLEDTLKAWKFQAPIKRMTRGIAHDVFFTGPKNMFSDLKKPVALFVGRVAIEKNLEEFLAMPWVGSKVIVGDGPDFTHLKHKYPETHFVGVKKDKALADHYRSADLFVFPSKTDTFGMVLVEAMACGLPIVAHMVTGPVDIVSDEFLGALGDDLGKASVRALNSPGTAEQRAAHAVQNYSWRKAAMQFLGIDDPFAAEQKSPTIEEEDS